MVDTRLPAGWRSVSFGDVVRQVKDRVDPETSGLERYVAGEHMDTDDLRIRRWGTIGDGYLGPAFHMRFKPGHVLYGSRRTYLRKVAVANFEGICANTTFVLEPSTSDLLPEFLPLVMTTEAFHAHSVEQSKGSVNPYINFRDLTWYEFGLPERSIQERIVEVVEAAAQHQELTAVAMGRGPCLMEALIDEVVSEHSTVWVNLGQALTESPRNGITIEPAVSKTGKWSLTLASVDFVGYVSGGLREIREPAQADGFVVKPGELFIARSNTYDRVGLPVRIPNGEPDSLYFSDLLMRLRTDERRLPTWFLEHYLRTRRARTFIRSVAAGTSASMKKINASNVSRLPVPVVNANELAGLRLRIDAAEAMRQKLRGHLVASKRLGRALHERLMEAESHVQ
jgi:type I restriction enzyme S subunit